MKVKIVIEYDDDRYKKAVKKMYDELNKLYQLEYFGYNWSIKIKKKIKKEELIEK